jgi:aspartyl-tRNA(Asn)/glutamyl-tRNA(Gln) amidotransferase subunit C
MGPGAKSGREIRQNPADPTRPQHKPGKANGIDMSDETPAITRADVAHLARLARLAVTDEELDTFAAQLQVILSSVARVGEVAAEDIPPTSHVVPLTNVWRADEVRPSLPHDAVMAAAPAVEQERFRVPRILDEE